MSRLVVRRLDAFYGDFQALFGISLEVDDGETVAIIGANGSGKSTFLKAVAGTLPATRTAVELDGVAVGGRPAHELVDRGVTLVPEGRRIFPSLTVEENLRIGAYRARAGRWTLERVYAIFPRLAERRRQPGTNLSGGEQQMLAISRGLMANPRLLLIDEISLGLAPVVVKEIYQALEQVTKTDLTAIIVEQDVGTAQRVSNRLYCFQEGRVSLTGRSQELSHAAISVAYFGM